MRTIDGKIEFVRNLYNTRYLSDEKREQLHNELDEFKKNAETKSIIEQQQLFHEKFGQFLKIDLLQQKNKKLKAINNKLTFFVVLTIISILAALFSL